MRVLHVVPACLGGMRRHVLSLLDGLERAGHLCWLAFLTPDAPGWDGPAGGRAAGGGFALREPSPAAAWRLSLLLRELEPEVVHAHGARAALLARLALALPGTPRAALVYTVHGPSAPLSPRARRALAAAERWLGGTVDAYIAVSRDVATRLLREWRVPAARLHLVPNGVDPDAFTRLPSREEACRAFGLAPDRPVAGMVARLAPEKGPDLFLRAARLVRRLFPGCQFLLAGEGPLRPVLERQAAEPALAGTVRLPGHVADPLLALAALDVFVLPSRLEGSGLALLEAMAAGRPVVATSVGGINEAVVHRRTGLLVPPEDAYGLARAVAALLQDADLRRRLAAAARREVAARHSLQVMVRRTGRVYAAALRARLRAA